MTLKAKANIPAEHPAYKSQSERDWSVFGDMILQDEGLGETAFQVYEAITFHIPGGRYKPDTMHIMTTGDIVFVEVKGSKKGRGYARQRSKLRAATELHPWFTFVEAVGKGESWEVEVMK